MKKVALLLCLLLCMRVVHAQSRNATVLALNNYVRYANANMQALTATMTSLERYDGLFHDYIKSNRQLGGEPYEKPKASPFVDADMFTIGEDDPAHLYAVARKGGANLPSNVKTELNKSAAGLSECSTRIILLIDSMSNTFHGPLITVTDDSTALPYRLLYAARNELRSAKTHRDALFLGLRKHYDKYCPVSAPASDYIHSVTPLTQGVQICQNMLNDFRFNDPDNVAQYVQSLDSLCTHLEAAELTLLKGIAPIGNSKQFPNKGNVNGFDLYNKYEDIVAQLQAFSAIGKHFMKPWPAVKYPSGLCFSFHIECLPRFNGNQGPLYLYNEYVQLIGGGKMKLLSDGAGKARYIYRGWSDGLRTLPQRTLLLWMMDVPRFELYKW